MIKVDWFLIFLLIAFTSLAGQAVTEFKSARDKVHIYLSPEPTGEAKSDLLLIDFQIEPDWHLYWQNPGDTGTALRIRPERSQWANLSPADQIEFPSPAWTQTESLANFTYTGRTVFAVPLNGTLKRGSPFSVYLEWLVCREECIPESAQLELDSHKPVSNEALRQWLATKPLGQVLQGRWQRNKDSVKIQVKAPQQILAGKVDLKELYFFPRFSPWLKASAIQNWVLQEEGLLTAEISLDSSFQSGSESQEGLLGFQTGHEQAWPLKLQMGNGTVAPEPVAAAGPLKLLFLAFLGGLILNLMPCVFPVISLKIMSFAKHASTPLVARTHGLVFSLGVLLSFWFLAALLVGLKSAGHHLGWGFQLQDPRFLAVLILLFFLLSMNFLGLFEVDIPIHQLGKLQNAAGFGGSFFSGVLATFVATPCTAPFMGAAVGVALAQPSLLTFAIFSALGLGMAAPYLILSFSPGLLSLLPKPGRWMEILKQLLAFPMLLTVVWLLGVFSQIANFESVLFVQGGLVSVGFAVWLGRFHRSWAWICILLTFVLLSSFVVRTTAEVSAVNTESSTDSWKPFSKIQLETLRAEGKTVFVDFTASWCLSCQLNKKAVLETAAGQKLFKDFNVVLMKADWTQPNDEIEAFLASYQRSGIPFYPLFVAGKTQAVILPEVLTLGLLKDYLTENIQKKDTL
jgi:thiol:disulfide interchange protein DsbD